MPYTIPYQFIFIIFWWQLAACILKYLSHSDCIFLKINPTQHNDIQHNPFHFPSWYLHSSPYLEYISSCRPEYISASALTFNCSLELLKLKPVTGQLPDLQPFDWIIHTICLWRPIAWLCKLQKLLSFTKRWRFLLHLRNVIWVNWTVKRLLSRDCFYLSWYLLLVRARLALIW